MTILVLGGDGFCGWPTALRLFARDHDVVIVDNLARRRTADELGAPSLTPIADLKDRLDVWRGVSDRFIRHQALDVAGDYAGLVALIREERPEAIIHFAEQRAAPYSMRSPYHRRYTVENNAAATHNVLAALAQTGIDAHLVHLGTMGVYGYDGSLPLPEGYQPATLHGPNGEQEARDIVYPPNPGSVYHMTKVQDHVAFQFYAKNEGLRITDLHQGIVWGTQTPETAAAEPLINRFDYDGDYGTVLNRFLMQAAVNHPLTVHGTGGQTRAFIHIRDSVQCIELAVANPPARGDGVRIVNQFTEVHRVRDLAEMVSARTGAQIRYVDNPRKEAAENDLEARNDTLHRLGLQPTTLEGGLLDEITDIARRYAHRCDRSKIPCVSTW